MVTLLGAPNEGLGPQFQSSASVDSELDIFHIIYCQATQDNSRCMVCVRQIGVCVNLKYFFVAFMIYLFLIVQMSSFFLFLFISNVISLLNLENLCNAILGLNVCPLLQSSFIKPSSFHVVYVGKYRRIEIQVNQQKQKIISRQRFVIPQTQVLLKIRP